ncbi:PAS domain S-box protein [Deinococcus yavapaiensis]|uniref:histidine kinase n=1 Tax=Deinococcus yavapaiensis KR-236 TaxID=694435 RepID=A0A318SGQ9_9DEIO|nr:PAS domain S-box protein [Deinococcus yavapaiensis]PYE53171.1 PAS domain S-box-containing protein [Deinococcus yavapaiensis KR-236]
MTSTHASDITRLTAHLHALQHVTRALTDATTTSDVSRVVFDVAFSVLDACEAGFALQRGDTLEFHGGVNTPDVVRQSNHTLPLKSPLPIADASRIGQAVYLETLQAQIDAYPKHETYLRDRGIQATTAVPFASLGVRGALVLCFTSKQTFDVTTRAFLEALAMQIGAAVARAELIAAERSARSAAEQHASRLRAVVEASTSFVWLSGADGQSDEVAAFWSDLTGQTREEGAGWGWLNAVHERDRQRVQEAWTQAFTTRTRYDLTFGVRAKGGEERFVSVRGVPRFEDGQVVEWTGSFDDVTERVKVEAQLREREARLALLLEHAPAAIAMFDQEMRYLAVSNRFRSDFRLPHDLVGRFHYDVFPDTRDRWLDFNARALAGEELSCDEDAFERTNGSVDFVRWTLAPWRAATGEVGGVILFAEVITEAVESRRRDAYLLALEERLRAAPSGGDAVQAALEHLGVQLQASLCVLMDVQPDGETGVIEREWRRVSIPSVLGRHRLADYGEVRARLVSDGHTVVVNDVEADVRTAKTSVVGAYEAIGVRASLDVPLMRGGTLRALVSLASSEPRTWRGSEIDLARETLERVWQAAERSRVEDALRASESRLRLATDAAQTGTWDFDLVTNTLRWDERAKALFGLPADAEVTYTDTFLAGLHPDDRAATDAAVEAALDPCGSGECDLEYRAIGLQDGVERWIGARGRAFFEGGRAVRLIGTVIDLSERKRVEAQLREMNETLERRVRERTQALERSNAELERFAYIASHDLQEPIRTVTSFSGLLEQRYDASLDERGRLYLKMLRQGASRMKTLVDDLLAFSRLKGDAAPLKPVDLNLPLSEALARLERRLAETEAHVTCDTLPTVLGDGPGLSQVFQNLIGNAVKFVRPGVTPEVHVGVAQESTSWHVTVADNGVGIEEAYLERIFELFQRLHPKHEFEGTGLGLGICRMVVERHGGRIWAESTIGVGSVFHFTLPVRSPEA